MKLQKKESFAINKELFITTSTDNILNHYDFHPKQLGRGAYGVVYKARQKNTEGPWRAVKKIPKKMIKQPELLANEIKILKTLDHPSIIRLYQCYEDQKNLFLVTDLCQGGELFDRLQQQGNFSQAQAKILFKQMLEGINYCHHQKIAHRDLKPQNFLFLNKNDMNLKIIDFGLSYPWAESMKKQIQQKGQKKLIGTSYYIAPQIIQGSYDQRCDIWSLGVILYILVTAVPPFDGQGDKQIIANVRKHNYTLNVPEMKDVSQSCKDLIKRILVPEDKRLTIDQIFKHPWMVQQASSKPLKINFNKVQNFSKFSKLKKLAATYIASKMSEKQVQELGKLFKEMDLNHDGQISIQQLKVALSDQKNKSSLQELKQIMESIDTDKNGKLNYTEFLAFAMQKEKLFKQENVKSAFRMLDKDGNGFVEKSQLLQVFAQNGLNQVNGKSIDELIKSCDKDGNGIIDYNEFKAAML